MEKDIYKQLIIDFQERDFSNVKERSVSIPENVDKIISLIGIRRCGKTWLLYSLINKLRQILDPQNIAYLNAEDDRIFPMTVKDLDQFVNAYYELYPDKKNEKVYLFFDEIQHIENWELFIRRIYDTENCRIYITGSSSQFLSKEIATSLRGRSITYEIFPLSFREFLHFKGVDVDIHSSMSVANIIHCLSEYVVKGGFPEIVDFNKELYTKVLQEYFEMIMYKDIIERYNITNNFLIKFLIRYLFVNVSTLLSINKLYNDLKSQGFKVSKNTLYNYISYVEDAYGVFNIPIFRNSRKEELRNPKKIYSADTGFKTALDYSYKKDIGHIYENIVFLELRRSSNEIFYFKQKQEVDFYVILNEKPLLINVSYSLENRDTEKREIQGMLEALEYFSLNKGYIITSEKEDTITLDTKEIQIIPLWKWLVTDNTK